MLLDPGGDGEDVRVEDNILRREADLLGEDVVGAGADLDLLLLRVRLALFVEGHNDHGGAVILQEPRLSDELLLTLLQADGVDHRLALHALQARLDNGPLTGVDHHRYPRDVRLRGDEVQEVDHRFLAFEHPLVHVDVYNLGTVLYLLSSNIERRLVVAREYQVLKPRRTSDVGTLAHVHEQRVRSDVGRL